MKAIKFIALATLFGAFSSSALAVEGWTGENFITELEFIGTDGGDGIFISIESGSQSGCTEDKYHMSSGDNGYEQISDLAKIAFLNGLKIDLYTNNCHSGNEYDNLKRARLIK